MYRKNTAGQFVCYQLLLTASGAVGTGLSPAVRRCIDGTFGSGGGTSTEDGTTGSYKYAMSQADTNGNDISFIFSAATAMPVCVNIVTTAADPTNATTFGLTDIDAAISSRMATFTLPTNFSSLSITAAGLVAVTSNVKQNVALANFPFEMVNSSGNPATGLTVTATRRIDNGSFSACANSVTEIANGWYTIDFAASDLNGKTIAVRMTATGASDNDFTIITQP